LNRRWKPSAPQALPEAAEPGVIGRQFLSAQAQERLEEHVPEALLLNVPVPEVVEELQEHHFEDEHRVPRGPGPKPRRNLLRPL